MPKVYENRLALICHALRRTQSNSAGHLSVPSFAGGLAPSVSAGLEGAIDSSPLNEDSQSIGANENFSKALIGLGRKRGRLPWGSY